MDRMPEIDLPFTPGHPRRNEPGSAWVQMDLPRLEQRDTYSWSLRAPPGQERLPVILFGSQPLLETMDDKVLEQIGNVARLPGLVGAAVTMPDAHWGYGFPIRYALSVDLESGPVADDRAHRFDHPTTAKAALDGAGRKQALIEVVMEHASEVLAMRARQRDGSVFHDSVVDRVRVSQPLALDDLERLLAHRLARQLLDAHASHGSAGRGLAGELRDDPARNGFSTRRASRR
jgi:hypothetical protein